MASPSFPELPWWLSCKEPTWYTGDARDTHSIPGSGRSPGGHDNPLQYSCLENPMDRGAWCLQSIGLQKVGHSWRDLVCMPPPFPTFLLSLREDRIQTGNLGYLKRATQLLWVGFLYRAACLQDKLALCSSIPWYSMWSGGPHHEKSAGHPTFCLGVCSVDHVCSSQKSQGSDLRQRSRRPDFSCSPIPLV